MNSDATHTTFESLLAKASAISHEVAVRHADDVDKQARFPAETIEALKQARLLSAPVPQALGGAGLNLSQLAHLCAVVGRGCGSSGMILAMHYNQLACLTRHAVGHEAFDAYLRELVECQYLVASITSEQGTFGDTRSSICAVQTVGDEFTLEKNATTGSYCAEADAILVTCRRHAEAASNDQAVVLVKRGQYTLTATSDWDTLGMRGTRSPGYLLSAKGLANQIVPCSFAQCSAETMVPYSHVLWSALWAGIAADAVARAAACVRSQARKTPGETPPAAQLLADAVASLQALRQQAQAVGAEFDAIDANAASREVLSGMAWALKCNNLKVSASNAAPQVVHQALQIIGIMGYKNGGPYSVGRHYRDVLSASLMISNERILAKSADLLLVLKDF